MTDEFYTEGKYLEQNPRWHEEDSKWKAGQILDALRRWMPYIAFDTLDVVCDIGCGSGEILAQLQEEMPQKTRFVGYEISPQAFEMCAKKANKNLTFRLGKYDGAECDLMLVIDVIEHVEDYFTFLRNLHGGARYYVFHIPLEIFALSALYPPFIAGQRKKVGHIHYFTKDIALSALADVGYKVFGWQYTPGYELDHDYGWKDKLLRIPRRILFKLWPDFTVKAIGGYGLLVLAMGEEDGKHSSV